MVSKSAGASTAKLLSDVQQAVRGANYERAIKSAEAAVVLAPRDASAWNALGVALRASGRPQSAILSYRRALDLEGDKTTHVAGNIANALTDLGRFDEAISWHESLLRQLPSSGNWCNFGRTLRKAALYQRALHAYEESIKQDPKNKDAAFGRAMALLTLGDYVRGWPAFESRLSLKEFRPPLKLPASPRWGGQSLMKNSALFVWPEQGFGDSILSTRFLPAIRERVGRVLLGVKPELQRLFEGLPGVDELVPLATSRIPEHVTHTPIMSLARHVMGSLDDLPAPTRFRVPYTATQKISPLLAQTDKKLKVGIVWSGSVTFSENATRAVGLERFLPLAEVPQVQLFSLQKGPKARELADARVGATIIDLAPHLSDFADTAAAIQNLDVIVMTDSSVAHLAASLGKPVWNLLSYSTYWLYLENRSDSPWYPSMRLFRQPVPGDWDSVFSSVKAELVKLAAHHVSIAQ